MTPAGSLERHARALKRYLHRRRPRGYWARERHSDPFASHPWTMLDYTAPPGSPLLVNVANFGGNAGDVVLPVVLRDLFVERMGPLRWQARHVHTPVGRPQLHRINHSSGLVIGGGGLLFTGTNRNSLSGWQWSCSLEMLERITAPIVVFGVGYNQFRGQEAPGDLFVRHVTRLVDKAAFVGLRNTGSVEAIRALLPEELADRVVLQPCMTTILREVYPHLTRDRSLDEGEGPAGDARPVVGLNCAFDRADLRFSGDLDGFDRELEESMRRLSKRARIVYLAHTPHDERTHEFLSAAGVPIELRRLYGHRPADVVRAYTEVTVMVGMRGHAQMIPFGCGRPIVSLISHEKLRYFLDDIDAPDWGVDVNQPDLADALVGVVEEIIDDLPTAERRVEIARRGIWDLTCANLDQIRPALAL